jgi:hypothetical protein
MSDVKTARIAAVAAVIAVVVSLLGVAHVDSVPPAAANPLSAPAPRRLVTANAAPAVSPPATTAQADSAPSTVAVTAVQPATPTTTAVAAPGSAPSVIGAQALAMITYPWAQLGYQLAFHGPKTGFLGITDCTTRHIDIYVTATQTVKQVEFVTAFEMAHAVDCVHTSTARQSQWPALRGFHQASSWFPNCTCSEDNFASGDFAEVFALWQAGPVYPWRSTLAPAPKAAQLALLIPFLEGGAP